MRHIVLRRSVGSATILAAATTFSAAKQFEAVYMVIITRCAAIVGSNARDEACNYACLRSYAGATSTAHCKSCAFSLTCHFSLLWTDVESSCCKNIRSIH